MPEHVADPQQGGAPSEGSPSADNSRNETEQLRQQLARAREANQRALPQLQVMNKLYEQVPGGKEIVEAIARGETVDLSKLGAKDAAPQQGKPLTREEAEQMFREAEEARRINDEARREMDLVHQKAIDELPGYKKLAGTPEWNQAISVVMNFMRNGALTPPDDADDPMYWAVEHTYRTLTGVNPGEKGKNERPAEQGEAERRAAVAGQQSKSAGAPEDNSELKNNKDYQWATSRGRSTVGKSFANHDKM